MVTRRCGISVLALLALTAAVYIRPSAFWGSDTLVGIDYFDLHVRRIAFAQAALFGPRHFLPAWYPREFFGTPFSANLQSFPWIPTRLLLILLPNPRIHYAVGVLLAALLAALCSFLFCRRMGLSELASAAAAWTFASAGFFASRVFAGHLPVLEGYASLPLLLWLADRAASQRKRDLAALAIAAACFAVAGHPQIPAYSLSATALFLMFRTTGRNRLRAMVALLLGMGSTLAAWWPMVLLAGRSTRVLALDPAENDITFPLGRLRALILPGIDGWPESLHLAGKPLFNGYPGDAWFWDTATYIGLLPIGVTGALLMRMFVKKRLPGWPWGFVAALGVSALFFALPPGDFLRRIIPITLFRSPARLLYISTFSASMALGFGVDAFLRSAILPLGARRVAVALCLAAHFFDLGGFARCFVQTVHWGRIAGAPPFAQTLLREVKDERVASDAFTFWCEQHFDRPGGFDSIILNRPYRALLEMTGDNPRANEERFESGDFPVAALRSAGARFVVTGEPRDDLELVSGSGDAWLYRVPDPAPRGEFAPAGAGAVVYTRPSSDLIQLETVANVAGTTRVLESWDPGWTATVDGRSAPVVVIGGFTMGVPVDAGRHVVRMSYRTPGRTAGLAMSLACAALLGVTIATARPAVD